MTKCIGHTVFVQSTALRDEDITAISLLSSVMGEHALAPLRLTNRGRSEVALALEPWAWRMAGGSHILAPAHDVTLAPARIVLQPHIPHVVRVALSVAECGVERAYRILLRRPALRNANAPAPQDCAFLPLFVTPTNARPRLELRTHASPDGNVLTLTNSGAARLQILDVEDLDTGRTIPAPAYLLAQSSVDLSLLPFTRHMRVQVMDTRGEMIERIAVITNAAALAL